MCGARPSRWASGPSRTRPAGHNRPSAGPPDLTTMDKGMQTCVARCPAAGPAAPLDLGPPATTGPRRAPLTSQPWARAWLQTYMARRPAVGPAALPDRGPPATTGPRRPPLTSQIPILCVHHLAGRRHCLLLAWQGRGGHNDFHRMLVSLLPLVRPRGPAGRLQSALSVCAALCSPAAPGLSQYMLMCCGPGCGPGRV